MHMIRFVIRSLTKNKKQKQKQKQNKDNQSIN